MPTRVDRDPLVPAFITTVAIRDDGTIGLTYFDFRKNTVDAGELSADAKRDSPRWKSPPLVGETAT
jgi:hypothetical protein